MKLPTLHFTSVRQKLFAGALFTSLVALLVAGVSLFAYDLHTYRQSSLASLSIEAELLGHASTAALQFDDVGLAATNLAFLRARPTVRAAATYNPRGTIFATYLRSGVDEAEIPKLPEAGGASISGNRIGVFHRIVANGEIVGTVYLSEDLEIGKRVASYVAIAFAVMLAALLVAAFVSTKVQKGITRQIAEIAGLARGVIEKRDYSLRARRTTADEIGTLVDAFNEMLEEIQKRTAALEASAAEVVQLNRDLERRVSERTSQLEESNLQLKAANLAKSSFLSMMSHEIRTPMNGVLGMLELLSLSDLDAQQRGKLEIIRDSGRSLLRIIDDILDFSKIEAGKLEVQPEVASIERIVATVGGIYAGNASSKGLVLEASTDPAISPAVLVDPLRLQQILNNLVSNAIKFTRSGEVRLRAELAERREGVDVVAISVTDTGVGIAPEGIARLFQPFSQADADVARTFGGTGLGLSIGQRLAGLMGGEIAISSKPGRGTVATVTLPLPVADPSQLPAPEREAGTEVLDDVLQGRRKAPTTRQAEEEGTLVMVVDDHPVNRMLLSRQVALLGYAYEDFENGRQALEAWKSGRFALILTDCNMPEMDGYDLTRTIRRRERAEGSRATVIIACTANALAGESEVCFAAGMDDYIAKPVNLARLAEKLDNWLPLPGREAPPPAARAAARAQPAEATPVIDAKVLAEVSDGNVELERDILEQYASVTAEDIAGLDPVLASRDATQAAQAAHRIRGASRAVGAVEIARASTELEAAAKSGDWAAVEACLAELKREAERLAAHVAGLGAQAGSKTPERHAH